jgi:hypothetical protein
VTELNQELQEAFESSSQPQSLEGEPIETVELQEGHNMTSAFPPGDQC